MATPKKKKTTLRQTGLTITRSGNTFTHAWKIPQAYTSQSWFYSSMDKKALQAMISRSLFGHIQIIIAKFV